MAENQINFSLYDALKCLNSFCPVESYLGPTVMEIIEGICEAREKANYARAWHLVSRVLQVCDDSGIIVECAEARTKCSIEVLKLGHLEKAAELLGAASGLYHSYEHQRGIVHWMLGCVLWQSLGQENAAISTWRRSIQIFDSIPKNKRFLSEEERNWYKDWTEKMKGDLKTAIENRDLREKWIAQESDIDIPKDEKISDPLKPSPDEIPAEKPIFKKSRGYLQGFSMAGSIPAGTPLGVLPAFEDEGEIDRITIDEMPYLINRVDGSGGRIPVLREIKHYLLRVMGDSMNLTNIEDGDYVLICQTDHANHNDIVAVEIVGYDDRATLKRYLVRKGKIIFQPESTNPDHVEYTIDSDDEFRVHGKVIAILKKE